ncbi:hypothetical protein [Bradyrhizobium sp.]|uniref:bestrophin-like domain n=1 Tax=Bradyrhizobium sp. TaxID=376 RepID=UPI0023936324|nr:hypothetical protein [Bradyrhizobium sp.]MDE2378745.1 hypothetical protein [Bradyrhizobium sp.]
MLDLYDYSLLSIFLVGVILILAASEIGRRIGIHASASGGGDVSTLESAVLGLMALMIGFTFAMALSRFEARRDAVLNEANAIGTTALRARLLPQPERGELLKLLREYVAIRLDITRHPTSRTELAAAVDKSNALQEALWLQAKAMSAKDAGMVPTGLFIQTLNDMIDQQGKRLAALRNRVPNIVMLALFGIAAVGAAFTGYGRGLEARRTRLPLYLMALLLSSVILLILDLDRPTAGFIEVSQQPMVDTAASIAAFPD